MACSMILLFVGFWELVVIAVVAIMLLDTSSLLKTARFLGHLYQRVQKSISDIRSHITLSDVDNHESDTESNGSGKPPAG